MSRLINPHQVHEHSPWDMFSSSSLREKSIEGVISSTDSLVGRHLAIRLDAVLKAIQLPTGIANLAASLSDVDGDALTLQISRLML